MTSSLRNAGSWAFAGSSGKNSAVSEARLAGRLDLRAQVPRAARAGRGHDGLEPVRPFASVIW